MFDQTYLLFILSSLVTCNIFTLPCEYFFNSKQTQEPKYRTDSIIEKKNEERTKLLGT